jgi:hypothetical protein
VLEAELLVATSNLKRSAYIATLKLDPRCDTPSPLGERELEDPLDVFERMDADAFEEELQQRLTLTLKKNLRH